MPTRPSFSKRSTGSTHGTEFHKMLAILILTLTAIATDPTVIQPDNTDSEAVQEAQLLNEQLTEVLEHLRQIQPTEEPEPKPEPVEPSEPETPEVTEEPAEPDPELGGLVDTVE